MGSRELIIGLDLSLRRPAMCAIWSDWECDVKRVACVSSDYSQSGIGHTWRLVSISELVAGFVRDATPDRPITRVHVYVEDYPFASNTKGARALAELRGAVAVALTQHLLDMQPVNINSARKLLLGKVPQGKGLAKRAVFESLVSLGAPVENDDEADAFAVANYGLMERGWGFVGAGSEVA